jgi:8-oxo-dGTP pyrophosphatase MutT (NUDIX family)
MGDWTKWLIEHGKLTPEEAGEYDGRDTSRVSHLDNRKLIVEQRQEDAAERRIKRESVRKHNREQSGQRDLFDDRWPTLGRSGITYTKPNSPTISMVSYRWTSAGGVVVAALTPELIEHIYLVKPSGSAYGKLVFPKGRVDFDKGETKELAAIREVAEEAGVLARPVPDGYLGEFSGSHSVTHFYLMFKVKDSAHGHDSEMEQVFCVHLDEAQKMLEQVGNYRDLKVLAAARTKIAAIKANLLKETK